MMRLPPHDDRGSVTLELAIIAPALLLLLALVVVAGRVTTAAAAVEQAARAAAREASLARSPEGARDAATAAARAGLDEARCTSSSISVDTSGFAARLGSDGSVSVSIVCLVTFGDLVAPGIPGSRSITASSTSPLDRYRSR
ncbi:pilus assembly protein [Cellulomonas fimi]|uniref:TadE/TadG family type IV pilus assembly protein n=1 Tax=Cellulomonas fimi TaxID=1708 RepID=UPI00234C13BE|nr:TadE/TadG family type IV pilus assembly protein [Cellulomonas fimi]MDC7120561.1 pilus assembly protein [Cellulomonas fimi]